MIKRMFGEINIFFLIWPLHLISVPCLRDYFAFVYVHIFLPENKTCSPPSLKLFSLKNWDGIFEVWPFFF